MGGRLLASRVRRAPCRGRGARRAPGASATVAEAPQHLGGNAVAQAALQRAAALLAGDAAALPAIARRLDGLGPPYQQPAPGCSRAVRRPRAGRRGFEVCGAVPMGPWAAAPVATEEDQPS